MKKFGFATIIASGLVAGALGFAAPAIQAVASPVSSTTISVDSEVDEFTEFVVTLPRGMFAGDGGRA